MNNGPKKIPIGCSLRFTPKPPGRNYGRPRHDCGFFGGPWAGHSCGTRTGTILPIEIRGGAYVPDAAGKNMVWSAA